MSFFSHALRLSSLVSSTQTNSVQNYEQIIKTHTTKSKFLVSPCKMYIWKTYFFQMPVTSNLDKTLSNTTLDT